MPRQHLTLLNGQRDYTISSGLELFLPCYIYHISFLFPQSIIPSSIWSVNFIRSNQSSTMRASIATATFSLTALCAAQPYNITSSKLSNTTTTSTSCISTADAILIANGFGQILSNFSTSFGDTLIADGYVDQSDSVATLMHSPNLLASDVCLPLAPLPSYPSPRSSPAKN